MSLRRTIFVAVFLAVFATASLEGLLDIVVDRLASDGALLEADESGAAVDGLGELVSSKRLLFDLIDIPLMLLFAFTGAWFLSRRIARPLKHLTHATNQVAGQSFPQRVPVTAGNDELSRLTSSFNDMAGAVQGYVDRERAFTRYASHELRTPLSAMRVQVERVELGLATADEVLPVVQRQVTQLEEVLAALLALARASGPSPDARLLAPLLEESLAAFPADKRQRLTVADSSPARLKVTHARLLQQALTNLVDNALRHGSGTTTVSVAANAGSLTVTVNDSGDGVPQHELQQVTEPFYRSSERGGIDPSGQGLGLAFVNLIARALDGSLTLFNTESGLEATLTLPIVAGS